MLAATKAGVCTIADTIMTSPDLYDGRMGSGKMNAEASLFSIPISREHGSNQISIEVMDPRAQVVG
jgi:hypothetical protein